MALVKLCENNKEIKNCELLRMAEENVRVSKENGCLWSHMKIALGLYLMFDLRNNLHKQQYLFKSSSDVFKKYV